MTEPTAEQVEAERERAHELVKEYYGLSDDLIGINALIALQDTLVATALARVRIEAHAAGRDEGLREAETNERGVADSLAEWMSKKPINSLERAMLSLRANERYEARDAIRALRGRT